MILTRIGIRGLRNLKDAELQPAAGANLVYGANASGKTSLLEAVYLLAHARSFRSAQIRNVIAADQQVLLVHGQITDPQGENQIRLGIERTRDSTTLRLNQQSVRQSSLLAQKLPLQLLTPESIRLLEQGPGQRRRYLDWGLFHVEHTFHSAWNDYTRALKQRNAALRSGSDPEQVRLWDATLVERGEQISRLRERYVDSLRDTLSRISERLLGFAPDFAYRRGWKKELDLESALQTALERDRQHGATSVGPHRADLVCLVDGVPAQERFSRGQLKMLVCAMRLAQAEHLAIKQSRRPIFLVDDIAAELDPGRRNALLAILNESRVQLFLTATEREQLDVSGWESRKMFHVEHGKIAEVV